MKKYLPIILGLLTGLLIYGAYHKGYKKGISKAVETIIVQRDTIYQFDTITRLKPVYLTSTVVDSIPYPVPVPGTTDTVWAQLPRTEREYGDSTYHAVVSGVEPSLDRIDVYQKTNTIHEVTYLPQEDTRRDFIALNAKFLYDRAPLLPITLDVGYRRGPLRVYAGAGYDIIQKSAVGEVGATLNFNF